VRHTFSGVALDRWLRSRNPLAAGTALHFCEAIVNYLSSMRLQPNGSGTPAQGQMAAHPSQRGPLSVSLELQADCFAGVWGHAAYDQGKVSRTEIADALDAAAAVGDDRIQRATRGRVLPETFTHGSSASRQKWFTVGT
jgi:hypothetical protein